MPEKETLERAREDEREGKAPSTQAGEFVREEIDHVREGKHGARSVKQAIAIGLSKARRAGVKLPAPSGSASPDVRKRADRDIQRGRHGRRPPSRKRSRAVTRALKKESTRSVSPRALASQARTSARRCGAAARERSAQRGVRTKGKAARSGAAKKAARTRSR